MQPQRVLEPAESLHCPMILWYDGMMYDTTKRRFLEYLVHSSTPKVDTKYKVERAFISHGVTDLAGLTNRT